MYVLVTQHTKIQIANSSKIQFAVAKKPKFFVHCMKYCFKGLFSLIFNGKQHMTCFYCIPRLVLVCMHVFQKSHFFADITLLFCKLLTIKNVKPQACTFPFPKKKQAHCLLQNSKLQSFHTIKTMVGWFQK